MTEIIIIKYLVILPIITGFGMAFKELDGDKFDNQYIPLVLPLIVGVPLALLLSYMPTVAEPVTQGLLMGFTGVFGHKIYKYIVKKDTNK